MSTGWSWFITLFTIGNVLACVWLLTWSSRRSPGEAPQHEVTGHKWDGNLEEYNNPLPRWWLWLFYLTIAFGIVYLIVFPGLGSFKGVAGWSGSAQYEEEMAQADSRYGAVYERFAALGVDELSGDADALRIGAGIFANNCQVCHGANGRGMPGFPNLADADWQYGGSADAIVHSIAQGRAGVMPAFAGALGEQGISEVTSYVLSLSGSGTHEAALVEAGQARFALCAACHGVDGKGNQALGAPNLTDDIWLYGGTAADIRTGLVNGRNGQMPAHAEILTEDKIRLVAAYVMSLADGG